MDTVAIISGQNARTFRVGQPNLPIDSVWTVFVFSVHKPHLLALFPFPVSRRRILQSVRCSTATPSTPAEPFGLERLVFIFVVSLLLVVFFLSREHIQSELCSATLCDIGVLSLRPANYTPVSVTKVQTRGQLRGGGLWSFG